jgi:hypothetical protein
MKKPLALVFILSPIFLIACNFLGYLADRRTEHPGIPPSPTEPTSASPAQPSGNEQVTPLASNTISFYSFLAEPGDPIPVGSVVILRDILILVPENSMTPRTPDPAENLRLALQIALNDLRNLWDSTGVKVKRVTFQDGAAIINLEGEYFATGDAVLIAARYQILLTVFGEPQVKNATIKINGRNIANLGISHEIEARPDGYTYSRREVEIFISEHSGK